MCQLCEVSRDARSIELLARVLYIVIEVCMRMFVVFSNDYARRKFIVAIKAAR